MEELLLSLLIALGSWLSGYSTGFDQAEMEAADEKRAALERVIQQQAEIDAENREISAAWLEAEVERRAVVTIVSAEVPKYVTETQREHSACNLTVGAECLLNAGRLNVLPETECGSLTVEERRAPSAVTQEGLIAGTIECQSKYGELLQRHDALASQLEAFEDSFDTDEDH